MGINDRLNKKIMGNYRETPLFSKAINFVSGTERRKRNAQKNIINNLEAKTYKDQARWDKKQRQAVINDRLNK